MLMVLEKVVFPIFPSFRWKPESSKFNMFWMPDPSSRTLIRDRHDD